MAKQTKLKRFEWWMKSISNIIFESNDIIRTTKSGINYSYRIIDFSTATFIDKPCKVEFIIYDKNKNPMVDRTSDVYCMSPNEIDAIFSLFLYKESKQFRKIREQMYNSFISINELKLNESLTINLQDVLNETVKHYKWKDIDEFVDNRIFPKFLAYKTLQQTTLTKDNFYNEVVSVLKNVYNWISEYKDGKNYLGEINEFEANALLFLLDAIEKKDKAYLNRIMKEWDLEDLQISPEKIIYDMAFPEDNPFDKPIPLKVSDIKNKLRKNRCALVERTIQKLCDKMNIPRNKTKTGRPKTTNTEEKK